ncbi:MAG: tetratricopeptide repeat protein [Ghiorsea sp.]
MNNKKQDSAPIEATVSATEMVELKRDMQHAQLTAWLEKNQQQLIAAAVVVLLALVGVSLWKEQQRTQQESASLLYMKAMSVADQAQKDALLGSVVKDYAGTGYAILARQKQGSGDNLEAKKASLEALMHGHAVAEVSWQARLDLAELHLAQGERTEAKALLETRIGKHYEQARYALLVKTTEDAAEKKTWIEKALNAESHDTELVATLEAELALLQAAE